MVRIRSEAGTTPIELEVDDSGGDGRPVVLVHGWPLSGASWDAQRRALVDAGARVVSYDRRGFGASDQPADGYDYDTFTGDLRAVIEALALDDVVLIGFSMGGGEVARYVGTYGTAGLAGVAFVAAVPPFLLQTPDNPEGGLDDATVENLKAGLAADRTAFFAGFVQNFYSSNGELVADQGVLDRWLALAAEASTEAAVGCIEAFSRTDFRGDLSAVDVPTLVVHGDADAIVPFDVSGRRTAAAVPGARLEVIEGGPHGLLDTHPAKINDLLVDFVATC